MSFSLVAVLMLAKILWLAGQPLPHSIWLPPALFWQDVAAGLLFGAFACRTRYRSAVWLTYAALLAWVALNVPIARTLSSPLSVTMLRAAGGPLADSIGRYVTPGNIGMMILVVTVGALVPRLRFSRATTATLVTLLLALAVSGPFASSRIDVRGADRNALTSLLLTAMPRVAAIAGHDPEDWRRPPFGSAHGTDLAWMDRRADGRNVVMIVLESTAAQYLRSYGAADDPMPALTALASHSLQFDAAYAVYPESIKGLFAVMCSRHPALDTATADHARAACAPLPRVLGRAGYQTALFHSGRFAYLGMQEIVARQGWDVLADAGDVGGQHESSFGVDEPSTVAAALSWIDSRDRTRPFFLAYLPIAGHHPYETPVPGPFRGQGEFAAYKNALRYADTSVDALVAGLRSRGLDHDTMLVVFGDHGEAFGQHDGNVGHTFFAFEENVHVPLLISIPAVTTRPLRSDRVASVIDIAPTILALTGTPVPPGYEGTSLLSDRGRLAFFFTDYSLAWAGLRDGCWKYLLQIDANRSQLFDVCGDAGETRDRAPEHTERVAAYRERVVNWAGATRWAYSTR